MVGQIISTLQTLLSANPVVGTATLLLVLAGLVAVYHSSRDPLAKIPGPLLSRWSGIIDTLYYVQGHRHDYVHKLHQKYGPIVRYAPGHIDVSDIDAVKKIHTASRGYVKSEWYRSLAPPGVDTLMNITEPRQHNVWRRLLGAPFQDNYLQKLEPIVDERMSLALSRMAEEAKSRGCVDVMKWWIYMTLDIITELSYGDCVGILDDAEKSAWIIDYLEGLGPMHAVRTTLPTFMTIATWLRLPLFDRLLNAQPRATKWATETIQVYKGMLKEENPKPTLFTPLFEKGDKGFTELQIVHLAGSNITAGSHTTASVMTFTVWAICKNPEIRERLVAEVAELPAVFEHNDIRGLPYLNRVIRESLRLYAAVPSVLPRVVPTGGAEFSGYYIPEGTIISTQCYSLHRRGDYFPDPLRFDPDRWISPIKEMEEAFLGFGAGTRSCVGMNLAHMEMRLGIVRFFRKFPQATVSQREGMCDDDMRQRAWVFMSPINNRCLIDV